MTKPSFPKDLMCDEMEPSNRNWFEKYRRQTKHPIGYYQTIENFLRYSKYKDKPFDTFVIADIEDYVLVLWENDYSTARSNGVIGAISGFRNFLIENCSFPKDFLDNLSTLRVNAKTSSDSTPLTLNQLKHIREYNKINITDEYIFEVYFQLGIDKQDLSICVPKNKNIAERCFVHNTKKISYNAKVAELFDKIKNEKELKLKISNVDYHYFKKVTDHLRSVEGLYNKVRQLNYSDILKSHDLYIFKCPNCGEFSENISKNWVLARMESDQDYRLDCFQCKGVPHGDGNY